MAARVLAIAEIVVTIGLILLIVWVVKPLGRPDLDLALRVLVGALLLPLHAACYPARQRKALAGWLPITLLAVGVSLGAGYFLVSMDSPENPALELTYYAIWAAAQQYALQSVVLLRLRDAGLRGRAAPPAAATLFALVHAPNPGLMILTLLGGLLWCSTFRRHPNVFAVALSHAVLAVVVVSSLPPEVTGNFRIGPAYLDQD